MWYYQGKEFTENDIEVGIVGFVYKITNLITGKKYIGKKTFYFSKTKKVKGKNKRTLISSDWNSYYGSNKVLQEDVEKHGSENYKREILYLCKTKSECSYLELREQIDNRVLESDDYYNEYIIVRLNKKHLKNIRENPT